MNSQDDSSSQRRDLLAAVVLHTLLSEARDGMAAAAVASACERDPDETSDLEEIEAALRLLLEDGLAERDADPRSELDTKNEPTTAKRPDTPAQSLYRPTRAAIRANELSF
ncbi:MAG TPA: hypothetical protein VGP18_06140 [Solirubrobacteraceae bacterium]|nr:hypothetical protein [Solirubrobacteraceae bacterium]